MVEEQRGEEMIAEFETWTQVVGEAVMVAGILAFVWIVAKYDKD